MKIAVCIKQVPLPQEGIMDPLTGTLIRAGIQSTLNVYDLPALETALRFKEHLGGTTTAFTMGPPKAEAVLREALSMGIDSACLVSDQAFAGADVLATAYTLMQAITITDHYDLIICGRQTTDGDTAQVGGELAQMLDIPYVSLVSSILSIDENSITIRQHLDHENLELKIPYPCLLSVEPEIYTPRLPTLKLRLAAGKKDITQLHLSDLADKNENHYGTKGSATKMVQIMTVPPAQKKTAIIDNGKSGAQAIYNILNNLGVLPHD